MVLIALVAQTPATEDQWWAQSQLIPHFELMESWTREIASDVGQMIWQVGGPLDGNTAN